MRFVIVFFALLSSSALPVPGAPGQASKSAAVAATGVAGKWHFVFQTDGGDRDIPAEFTATGDQVTGKFGGADVKGTFKDGNLDLAFPFHSEEGGMTATLKVKGALKDGKLAGTWQFSDYDGAFTATRAE